MRLFKIIFSLLFISIGINAQVDLYQPRDLDTVKWLLDDFGAMWTFDDVPAARFEKLYDFTPTDEWLGKEQRAALQFGGGCSAAFVMG